MTEPDDATPIEPISPSNEQSVPDAATPDLTKAEAPAPDSPVDNTPPLQYSTPPQYGAPQYGAPQYGSPQYGAPQPQYGPGQTGYPALQPDDYLVWAILSTVLCCLPLGIVSIVKSTSVSRLWAMGDHAGAQAASEDAKKFAIWSAAAAAAVYVLAILVYVIFFVVLFSLSTSTT